jgi:hypothetical protein
MLQNSGLTNALSGALSGPSLSSIAQPDGGQLLPFAQVLSTLQQLQQSNPSQYQQVTQQIATNLQTAAQTAQQNGNTSAAGQLNQLATDFTNASKTGQLPSVSDLAQAAGSHHHHHHGHAHVESSSSDGDSSSSSTSASGTSQLLSQLVSSLQVHTTQNDSLNPITVIENALSSAGLSNSKGR